jgi:hypothetical protein
MTKISLRCTAAVLLLIKSVICFFYGFLFFPGWFGVLKSHWRPTKQKKAPIGDKVGIVLRLIIEYIPNHLPVENKICRPPLAERSPLCNWVPFLLDATQLECPYLSNFFFRKFR